ncbi:porin family protein [Hymenobacter weizhouensis]|uniref:porin family protein n=1 Tax=Hymenobacter sp. YIM 151500-1 TaxID=2987689 RepID=UPI002227160E|nr:porin family protein [Hymenobacter sp. YIM 151500-1]UYZ62385.1 PorT family protein [Hymenobacter sp. YIM 151500-1]
MNTKRLFGRLAAATLVFSVFGLTAQAQIKPHRVPAYSGQAPARSSYSKPAASATDGVKIGIRAGVNVADWSGDAVQSVLDLAEYTNGAVTKEMRTGFHAGLYATLPLGPRFAIEPGVLYSEKGVVLNGRIPLEQFDFLNARVTATARMAYLDVPLLAKAYLTEGLYLYGGPQASFLLSGNARVQAGALGFAALNRDFDVKNQFRPVDFALTGGLGYQFQNGLGLSAGYDYGLSSLDKNNRFDAQNRVIKAAVNFSF